MGRACTAATRAMPGAGRAQRLATQHPTPPTSPTPGQASTNRLPEPETSWHGSPARLRRSPPGTAASPRATHASQTAVSPHRTGEWTTRRRPAPSEDVHRSALPPGTARAAPTLATASAHRERPTPPAQPGGFAVAAPPTAATPGAQRRQPQGGATIRTHPQRRRTADPGGKPSDSRKEDRGQRSLPRSRFLHERHRTVPSAHRRGFAAQTPSGDRRAAGPAGTRPST